ncbi:UDP-Glc:alpha-D-GlcNAc-diphosphoundecaprenol beta-1,3-glucosyltransferase WfgD [Streptomyces xanthophaeus]|uniref:glycosyltransferase family 2 protein n=1 Tax=Streptomyces xanthophaeus TaxID=67385 RepID=UPI00233F2FE3|nr:glycosyltransferase family A protein [Streptomyces xanthophaeus]WCD84483.1 UDP-Glc:alpha-D-GlcNAc-diphosphoundecaprenol beta-1,3-glucosyltransferase WfgD [Streptomyces xanthophaeus]
MHRERTTAGTATFVMPHYSDGPGTGAHEHLREAVGSLRAQSDPAWRLVIVEDASPHGPDRERVRALQEEDRERVVVLQQDVNRGQGFCRNVGVRWAAGQGAPFVLFLDADDIAHPQRLERTRRTFAEHAEVDFLYSTFSVIDELGRPVPRERLTPSVQEILDSHDRPVEGPDAWIRIGAETGYTSLTSTVSVRTALASAYPFPEVRGSEDTHAWLRMAAGGSSFKYEPTIPARYRIPQGVAGSSDRSRIGSDYYRRKTEVDTDGFRQALDIALHRGSIGPAEAPQLLVRFLRRLALTMQREGRSDLAAEILASADAPV